MALSFGKKKKQAAETDWSENALLDNAPAETVPASTEVAPVDGMVAPDDTTAPKKNPLLMVGIALLVLVAGAAAAYFLVLAPPTEDEEPTVVVAQNDPPSPDDPSVTVVGDNPPTEAVAPPGTAAVDVPAGDAGIAPEEAKPPVIQNPNVVSAPRLVPGPAVPTPVQPAQGLAGTPGRYGSRDVRLVPVTGPPGVDPTISEIALTPELMQQLKALWEQGAAAKHRGDYEAARQSWQRMLELRPGHPGIQEAIDKLPS